MSDWIGYDEFVDLVRNHHHDGFTGLVTGVSDRQHSFQIGFDGGQIVLLTYRVSKGNAALQAMMTIERAKVTEHPNTEIRRAEDTPETSVILSQLTTQSFDDTSTTTTNLEDVPAPRSTPAAGTGKTTIDARMREIIESAAVHHFGPIGAMVCEELLSNPQGDLRQVMLEIAREVGASEADTQAFFQSVSNA